MYQCFHCLKYSVQWVGDFDASDYGYEEPGLIHECKCSNCGAEITYYVPNDKEGEEEDGNSKEEHDKQRII